MIYTSSSSNALTNSESSDSWRKKNDLEKSKIASEYLSKGPLLEVGCGTGQILEKIKIPFQNFQRVVRLFFPGDMIHI